MTQRSLQIVQQLLIAAVTVVLALVVLAAFLRVVRPADPDALARAAAARATTTTLASVPVIPAPPAAEGEPASASTTIAGADALPCREEAPATGAGTVLRVYFSCNPSTFPTASSFVYRVVPDTSLVLTATLQELVTGPDDDERKLGFVSFFSQNSSDAFIGLDLAGGKATIDLRNLGSIPNVSTSSGSQFLMADLNANVFQFDTIDAVEYRLEGSCEAFWGLLQGDCHVVTRRDWERQVAAWQSDG